MDTDTASTTSSLGLVPDLLRWATRVPLLHTSPITAFPHDLRFEMCNSCTPCFLKHCRIREGLIARHARSVSVSMTYHIRADY